MLILQSCLQNVYNSDLSYNFDMYLTACLVQEEEKTIDVYNVLYLS